MRPYDRLIGAALDGERWLFAQQDTVEAAWRVVDPILGEVGPVATYPRGSWGPDATSLLPADETWYNPGDNKYYLASRDMPSGPVLGVIDAGSRQWLQNVPTNGNAHSVAADPISNHIYVPLPSGGTKCETITADGCVGVYAAQ